MKKNTRLTLYLPIIALSVFAATACVPGNGYDNSGNYGGYGDPGYYGGYQPPPPPPPPDRRYDCRYPNCDPYYGYRRDRDHHDRDDHRDSRWSQPIQPDHQRQAPPPPPKSAANIIRPSCPSDTRFDGKHCIIPENKRRKGGQGTISACPEKGMWVSGDRCVGP